MNFVPSDGARWSCPRARCLVWPPDRLRIRLCVLGALVCAAAALFAPVARASSPEGVEQVVIAYDAGGACPSRADFFELVRAYTTKFEVVEAGAADVRRFRVATSTRAPNVTGDLAITTTNGKRSERHVTASTCDEVTRALAIMVAVAIDPAALSSEPSGARAPGSAPTSDAPEEPTESLAPVTEVVPIADRPVSAPRTLPPSEPSPRTHVSMDVRTEVTSAVIDSALPVLGASVELAPAVFARGSLLARMRPSMAIGLRQSLPTEISLRGGSTEFVWTAGNLRLCPLRFDVARRVVDVAVCAETNVGSVTARPQGFGNVRQSSVAWLDVGLSSFLRVSATKRLFFEANVEVVAPWSRRRFELSSGALVSRAPAVGVVGGVGAGLTF